MLTVEQIINVAKVSQYLAANDIAKGALFGQRKIPITPQVLYMERKAVEWMYNLAPANDTLRLTANYLLSLCRGYNLQALNIVNGGSGGSVSPITPGTPPDPIEFVVAADTLIATGESSVTIPSLAGFSLLFVRGGVTQSMLSSESTYYSWDRDSAQFICTPAASAGELFQLIPV